MSNSEIDQPADNRWVNLGDVVGMMEGNRLRVEAAIKSAIAALSPERRSEVFEPGQSALMLNKSLNSGHTTTSDRVSQDFVNQLVSDGVLIPKPAKGNTAKRFVIDAGTADHYPRRG